MRKKSMLAVICFVVVAFAASNACATTDMADATGKMCGFCHVSPGGGGDLTPYGEYYSIYGIVPPPPSVTSITAPSGPNVGTISITNLAGTTFLPGITVKLKRIGYPDINASSVIVATYSKITCVFDLTGKKTGIWDIYVANSDGLSGGLASGFGINVASSASIVGATTSHLSDAVMTVASNKWRMRVCGIVQVINSSTFWLDDGSGSRVKVFAPGYSGIINGSYVAATGSADVSSSPMTLISEPANITKYL